MYYCTPEVSGYIPDIIVISYLKTFVINLNLFMNTVSGVLALDKLNRHKMA